MEKRYLDYEIMTLGMESLKKEVEKCLIVGNEDYLNELFLYGCWGDESELVNRDKDAMFKGMSLLHRESFSIYHAIKKQYSVKVIKTLLDGGVDPNLKDRDGTTALMEAAGNGKTQAVQAILSHPDTDPNLQRNDGQTALICATINGHTQAVQELLKHPDTNPNLKNYVGNTALMFAASRGDSQAVQELLKHPDIDPNLQNRNGWTALMYAASWGYTQAVQELLKHPKIKPNLQDNNYDTALMIAVRWARVPLQLVRELLKHPAIDITIENNENRDAWDLAGTRVKNKIPELNPAYRGDTLYGNKNNERIILLKELAKELLSTDVKDKERIRAITLLIEKI